MQKGINSGGSGQVDSLMSDLALNGLPQGQEDKGHSKKLVRKKKTDVAQTPKRAQ